MFRSNTKKAEHRYEEAIKLNEQGNLGLAHEKFMESLVFYSGLHQWERVACCLRSIGNVCYNLGDLEECKKKWSEALAVYEKQLKDKTAAGEVSTEIGDIYFDIKEFDGAALHYRAAISLFEEEPIGNDLNKSIANHKLGNVRFAQQRADDAEKHYLQALPVFEQYGKLDGIAKIFHTLGDIYQYNRSDIGSAKRLYSRSFDIWSKLQREDEKNELARTLMIIENEETKRSLEIQNRALAKQVRQLTRKPSVRSYDDPPQYQDDDLFSVSSASTDSETDGIPIEFKQHNTPRLVMPASFAPSAPPLQIDVSNSSRAHKRNHLENIFTRVSEKQNLTRKIKERKEAPSPTSKVIAGVMKSSTSPRRRL